LQVLFSYYILFVIGGQHWWEYSLLAICQCIFLLLLLLLLLYNLTN